MPRKVSKKAAASKSAGAKMDLDSFMNKLSKNDAVFDMSDVEESFISLGDYNLDRALGGGLPTGQIYSFQGPSGSGKTLMALQVSREIVNDGRAVLYFDVESKISNKALKAFGLLNNPLFRRIAAETLEDVLEIIMQAMENDIFGMIVIDSADALVTDEQNEREIHDGSKVGGYKAKTFSEWLGKVSQLAAVHDCALTIIRQVRDRPDGYGNPETTSGGRAIEFYSTTVLRLGPNKDGNQDIDGKLAYQGASVRVKKMNQGALPKDAVNIRFYVGDDGPWGVDRFQSVFDEAAHTGAFAPQTPTSPMYVPSPGICERLGIDPDTYVQTETGKQYRVRGRAAALALLQDDEELFDAVIAEIEGDGEKAELPKADAIDFGDAEEEDDE